MNNAYNMYLSQSYKYMRCISELVRVHASKDWLSMHTQGMQR